MALEKTNAAIADLQAAAQRLIAHCSNHESEIAQLQADAQSSDDSASAAIENVVQTINAAVPQDPGA